MNLNYTMVHRKVFFVCLTCQGTRVLYLQKIKSIRSFYTPFHFSPFLPTVRVPWWYIGIVLVPSIDRRTFCFLF